MMAISHCQATTYYRSKASDSRNLKIPILPNGIDQYHSPQSYFRQVFPVGGCDRDTRGAIACALPAGRLAVDRGELSDLVAGFGVRDEPLRSFGVEDGRLDAAIAVVIARDGKVLRGAVLRIGWASPPTKNCPVLGRNTASSPTSRAVVVARDGDVEQIQRAKEIGSAIPEMNHWLLLGRKTAGSAQAVAVVIARDGDVSPRRRR